MLFFSALLLHALSTQAQWSTATLSVARQAPGAASAGGKVFFAGGSFNSGHTDAVDIYDTGTDTWSVASLSQARYSLSAASAGSKVFFGGGIAYDESGPGLVYSNRVDIYDTATNTWTTATLSQPRAYLTATSAGGKVFFAGGYSGVVNSNVVDIYDTATNTWSVASLSQARYSLSATGAGGKVFFAGGVSNSGQSSVVDIYDTATNTWSVASLSEARTLPGATSSGNKVFFGGGYAYSGLSNVVDIYDTGTNTWSTATLSMARYAVTGASEGGKVFFAGGAGFTSPYATNLVDIYDVATNTWSTSTLSQDRYYLSAASAAGKVLFAGGMRHIGGNPGTPTDAVDIYSVTTPTQITQEPTPATQAICLGEAATTTVSATGQNLTYQWYRNQATTDEPVVGQTTATLFLSNVNVAQSGTYYLRVSGEGGVVWSSAYMLTVNPSSTFYADSDGDGYGSATQATQACSAPTGYVAQAGDCNDADPEVNPGTGEVNDGKDNNCDGQVDEGFEQTLQVVAPLYDCATGQLTLLTSGGNGQPIEYHIASVTNGWSSQSGYVLDAKLRQKGKALTIEARQRQADGTGWVRAELAFTPTDCPASGRLAASEPVNALLVTVLGNPVMSTQLEVAVRGAAGLPLQLQVMDLSGRVITQQFVESARVVETQRLETGAQSAGMLLLRVSTPTQQQVLKVVKP